MYDFNFADLFTASKKHCKLIILVALLVCAAIGAITIWVIPQKWSASASIALGNQATSTSAIGSLLSGSLGSAAGALGGLGQQGPTTDIYELLLRSWETRRQVVERCGLQKVLKENTKEAAIDDLGKLVQVDTNPPTSCSVTVNLPGTPRGLLPAKNVDMDIRKLTVECVNTYSDVLEEELDGLRISAAKSQRIFLQEQEPIAKAKFDKAQVALAKWSAKNHLPSPTTAGSLLASELETVIQNMITAQIQSQADARAIAEGKRLLAGQREMVPSATSETLNPQITGLMTSLTSVEQQLAQQQIFYLKTEEHPDVKQLLVQKQALMAQLEAAYKQQMLPATRAMARSTVYDTMTGALLTAMVDKAASDAKDKGLQAVLQMGKRRVETLAGQGLEYARLWEEVVLTQAVYENVTKQYQVALLSEKGDEPIFFVVDPPIVPYKRTFPSLSIALIVGLMLGLMVGVGIAFRRERRAAQLAAASTSTKSAA